MKELTLEPGWLNAQMAYVEIYNEEMAEAHRRIGKRFRAWERRQRVRKDGLADGGGSSHTSGQLRRHGAVRRDE